MRPPRPRLLVLAAALAAGCGVRTAARPLPFAVPSPGGSWQRVDSDADRAWYDPRTRAVIAVSGTCRGHKDAPLSILLHDLLIGTTRRRVLVEETVPLAGREARHAVVALEVDGVPMVFDLYVMKKDGCVYDLALLARPGGYDRAAGAFVSLVRGFRAEPGAARARRR